MKQHAGGWTLRSARARSIRHVVCCGLTFLALVQASGCEDDGSPAAPTLIPLATNRSPSPSGSIPGQALTVGGIAATVDMALYFTDPDGDALAYTATSGDTRVLIASVTGSTVVLNPVSAGGATATVMVTDPGGLTATQPIAVTVDHGDTRDTAAPISSNDNTQGALEGQGDVDYFGLVISSPETLTIETTGDTDTFGELESDDGLTIASADGGGDGGNFRIRQQVQTGTYYIRVSGATPAETGPYMLEVSETLGPDLVVESPGVTRATVDPEGSFNLSATVSNDGDEGSAATALRYYRSTDATITTSDTQVGTDAVGVLSALGTSAESIGLTGARVGRDVLLRGLRGRGERGVQHHEQLLVLRPGRCDGAAASDQPGPDRGVAFGERRQPGDRGIVHAVGDGEQQRGRCLASDDAALLSVDGCNDIECGHAGRDGRGGDAGGVRDQRGVDFADRTGFGGDVLLRSVCGRGERGVQHHEQLLVLRPGRCDGAAASDQPGPDRGVAFGERRQPGDGGIVHAVGDGEQQRGRCLASDDAALLSVDGCNDIECGHAGRDGRGGDAGGVRDQRGVDFADRTGFGGDVLLRSVCGRGERGVQHHEQLFGVRAGHCVGAAGRA